MEIYIPQTQGMGGSNESDGDSYTVQPGDTLESIAEQFGLELSQLIGANFKDGEAGQLSAGQELRIPLGDNINGLILYTVQDGDTTDDIAFQFNLLLTDLLRANPQLVKNPLLPGSTIKIPQYAETPGKPPEFYKMKLGDTLAEIAKRYKLSAEDLRQANPHIEDINRGYPGQEIKFPRADTETRAATSPAAPQETPANPFAFDNLSKARLQVLQFAPTLGSPPPADNSIEGEPAPAHKRAAKPSLPAPFDQWAAFIYAAAERYDLSPALIAAIIWCESGGNNIIARNGEGCGLMQIDARRYGDWLRAHGQGLEPASNIDFGASIVRACLDRFRDDYKAALTAYRCGYEAVERMLAAGRQAEEAMPNYAFDVLTQQEYFKKFFED